MKNEFRLSEKIVIWLIFIFMTVLALSILAPIIWAFYSSFKGELDYFLNILGLPKKIHFENYVNVLSRLRVRVTTELGQETVYFGKMFLNSLVYSSIDSFMQMLLPFMLAYAVSKYDFVGKKLIQKLNIFYMIFPVLGTLPSKLVILKAFGIYDNMVLYALTQNMGFGFYFLLLSGACKGISQSYSEAAFIDGAGHWQVLLRIMLPMLLPTLSMVFILNFVSSWNTYTPFLYFMPKFPNLFLGMYRFQHEASIYYATMPEVLAGLLIVAVPSAVLYISSQKLLMSNFIIGGIKG